MPELQICLLGAFQLSWDFAPVPASAWRNPYAAKLLKLLLISRPDPVPAGEAVRLVGGGMTGADLGPAVDLLRKLMQPGADVAVDEEGRLRFQPGAQCWIDIDALLSHYESGRSAAARGDMLPAILALQEADALYQGDLLEELHEPWVASLRARLQSTYTDILDRLAEGHAVLARYQDAVGFCHKALSHDPLREATYQRMMVYYYYLGDLTGAEEAYKACRYALENARQTVGAETVRLWERLRRNEVATASEPTEAAQPHQRDQKAE